MVVEIVLGVKLKLGLDLNMLLWCRSGSTNWAIPRGLTLESLVRRPCRAWEGLVYDVVTSCAFEGAHIFIPLGQRGLAASLLPFGRQEVFGLEAV